MQYVFVPLILVVLAALFWSWWSARSDRDPSSSVDSFNRALTAMQPGSASRGAVKRPAAGAGDGDTSAERPAPEPDDITSDA